VNENGNATTLGSRVSRARQEAGLTEKELAIRLGLPLWQIERIQNGDEDPAEHLTEIAETTGKPTGWFLMGATAQPAPPADTESPGEGGTARPGQRLRTAAKDLTTRLGRFARMPERSSGADAGEEGYTQRDTSRQSGARVARARQEAALSQKELGALLGLPLWRIERIERGEEDPTIYLHAIGEQTGRRAEWFQQSPNGAAVAQPELPDIEAAEEEALPEQERLTQRFRRRVVMVAVVLLVTIRFFTEVVHVLPRPAKLVDIPVLGILALVAAAAPGARSRAESALRYLGPAMIFLLVAFVSIMANLDRVAIGPTILFLYGFLSPVAVYVAVYQLWPTGNALSMSRLLVGLAAVEFVVVGLIDLPLFLASHNPDKVSGTFGENAYQLVIFLLVVAAVVAGIYTFESKRLAARLAPFFFVATLLTIFLAQYRAILLTMAATALLIAVLLGLLTLRGAVASVLIALTFVLSLSYVSSLYPELKYAPTVGTLSSDPGSYVSGRLGVLGNVGKVYTDNPRFILTGTGPGTYSSRAWYTFQPASRPKKGIGVKTSSKGYQTDVATKYVTPKLQRDTAQSVGGSYAVTTPFSSYTSLLAEVGIIGFAAMVLIYGGAFLHSIRMTIRALRHPAPGDPLPGLLLGCTAGFFILLQLAVLENWWEVTRLTFILWALLAVATKEFSARYGAGTPGGSRSSGPPLRGARMPL
jgi:transcriptional regulator with XRE-family HTH domain